MTKKCVKFRKNDNIARKFHSLAILNKNKSEFFK